MCQVYYWNVRREKTKSFHGNEIQELPRMSPECYLRDFPKISSSIFKTFVSSYFIYLGKPLQTAISFVNVMSEIFPIVCEYFWEWSKCSRNICKSFTRCHRGLCVKNPVNISSDISGMSLLRRASVFGCFSWNFFKNWDRTRSKIYAKVLSKLTK